MERLALTFASRKGVNGAGDGDSEVHGGKPFAFFHRVAYLARAASRGPNWMKRGNLQAKLITRGTSLEREVRQNEK